MQDRSNAQFLLFPGVKDDQLARSVAKRMSWELSPVKFVRFQGATELGGETKPEILCNVANCHCVVIWSPINTNDEFVQILQLIDGLKTIGEASFVTLMVPCYPYARQDKSHGRRESVIASLNARLLEESGMDRIVFLDIHADQIEGFFRRAKVRGLWMDNIWIDYLAKRFISLVPYLEIEPDKIVCLTPDEGALNINHRVASALGHEVAVHRKKRDWAKEHEIASMGLTGKVEDCLIYIRDDLFASGGSLFAAAKAAKDNGAKYVIALVTHAIGFDKKDSDRTFPALLAESGIDELITTNTLVAFLDRWQEEPLLQQKVTILDISAYLARVINRLGAGETIRAMMKSVTHSELYDVLYASEQIKEIERKLQEKRE